MKLKRSNKGFSLIEVIVAVPILAITVLTVLGSVMQASTTSKVVANKIAAKTISQSVLEEMWLDDYDDVTEANYPSVTAGSQDSIYLNRLNETKCNVTIRITGDGIADSGTISGLEDLDAGWIPGEWVGNTVFIMSGSAWGSSSQIISNTSTQLSVSPPFKSNVTSGSHYVINGGKRIQISTQWDYRGKSYRESVESLLIELPE